MATRKGNGKPLQYSCIENLMNSMKRQNEEILKEKLHRSVGAQYGTGDQWRNNSRKNERWSQSENYTQLWIFYTIQLYCILKRNYGHKILFLKIFKGFKRNNYDPRLK